jgi:hypothetical protein
MEQMIRQGRPSETIARHFGCVPKTVTRAANHILHFGSIPLLVAGLFTLVFGGGAFYSVGSLESESNWITGGLRRYSGGGGEEGGGGAVLGA